MAKVNDESIVKKEKNELKFPNYLCEEVKYCKKYVDPDDQAQLDAEEEVVPVFF